MRKGYKVIITGNNLYKEYVISNENEKLINIGTERNCHIRFKKELFFESFVFSIVKINNEWVLKGNDQVYFTTDGIMKLKSKELIHGDEALIKYANYNQTIFKLNFFIHFESANKKYNREIEIQNEDELLIGGSQKAKIHIKDELILKDSILLYKENNRLYIKDLDTKYGVYVNTEKVYGTLEVFEKDFIIFGGYYFYVKNNRIYTDVTKNITVKNLTFNDYKQSNSFKYPKFNRNSRIKYIKPKEIIEVLPPERLKEKPKNRLILTLIPALMMIFLTITIRGGSSGGGGSFIIFSIATMTVGVVMSIVTAIVAKKDYEKEVLERRKVYLEYIKEKEEVIAKIREKEKEVDKKINVDTERIVRNIRKFDKTLFEKDIKDEDFLTIRLGEGRKKAVCELKIKPQEFKDVRDDLIEIPEKLGKKYEYIEGVPITINLKEIDAAGIIGEYKNIQDLINNITLDIIGRHFYKDLKLFYMIREEDMESFKWIRWIKHLQNEALGIRNIICDEESKNILFEYLYVELNKRYIEAKGKEDTKFEPIVIIVLDKKGIYNHPICEFIECGKTIGVTFIFCEEMEENLPKGCNKIIRLQEQGKGILIDCSNGEETSNFNFSVNRNLNLEELTLKLAPIFIDEVSLEGELTKNISLFKLLDIKVIDDLNLKERWKTSKVYKSMGAPLGVKVKNEVVSLDLNEKKHGPHGLVAGTTGAGKSEILQSYILSMATLFHPYEIGFVIIDFKGGGMVNQFKDLPHLIGAITNIDGKEITRSLLSIKAELRKRQRVFSKYNVNHIDAYIKKFKEGEAEIALPHLILIVDEFAELKSDQPEFMKELISAARIGRSLGVHLILATQKPSGVIDEQIWSNSKFKLCLKVQNKNDSNEVLKSPLAAEIKEPGRAYLQVGNNEIFELFQSAYSGAPVITDATETIKEFEINEVNMWGKRKNIFVQKKEKTKVKQETELDVIVEYINEYCDENKIKKLPGICLPPLPEMIYYEDLERRKEKNQQIILELGLYDDPTRQLQENAKINLSEGNLFIVGSSQFGKTGLLQTIIRDIGEKYTPKEVNIYILDFASMILKNFEKLNHVGGVIVSSDDEKLKTFFGMMLNEIEQRKERLATIGISSFNSYKEAGYEDLPHIIVMLDNMTAFKELFTEREEEFLKLCREGIAVGITIVVANSGTNGIGYKYMANFAKRIALYCNDSGEYSSMFERCKMSPKNVPGRGIIDIEKAIYEYQTVLSFRGEKEIDRVQKMAEFIGKINKLYGKVKAVKIPEIPKELTLNYMKENFTNTLKENEVFLGIDFETIGEQTLKLNETQILSISGKDSVGKENIIKGILNQLDENLIESPVEVYIIDDVEKNLGYTEDYGCLKEYAYGEKDLERIIEEIREELNDRNELINEEGIEALKDEPLILVINNNGDAVESLSKNKTVVNKFKEIITKYKKLKIAFIFNDIPNVQVGFAANDVMKLIKENKFGIILDDIEEFKIYETNMTLNRKFKKKLKKNEGYLVRDTEVRKIKFIEKE